MPAYLAREPSRSILLPHTNSDTPIWRDHECTAYLTPSVPPCKTRTPIPYIQRVHLRDVILTTPSSLE